MGSWRSVKAKVLLAALRKIGWREKRQTGSHRILERDGWPDYVFAFHDGVEVGPVALQRVSKGTGLRPEDL